MSDLMIDFNLRESALEHLTSSVQLGFIMGTLIFAILSIADRYSPSRVFLSCALLGSMFNLGLVIDGNNLGSIVSLRFATGFFLAGIYPVGMKIAADHYEKGLGKSLGFLVGALALGTAFPHLAKELTNTLPWKSVLVLTSFLATTGGLLMFALVPDGPYSKSGSLLEVCGFLRVFKQSQFRAVAFGYFGHMWELYAFWVFVPIMLETYTMQRPAALFNIPLMSFLIIAVGGVACVVAGYLAQTAGTRRTASIVLLLSGMCCLLSPIVFTVDSAGLFVGFLLFWGMVVIADSPLFSTLVAQNAPPEVKGTALTVVNSAGFAITIVSIQLIGFLKKSVDPTFIYTALALGPLFGLIALYYEKKQLG
jgi:MFS family permease